jgi:hypothetical protein
VAKAKSEMLKSGSAADEQVARSLLFHDSSQPTAYSLNRYSLSEQLSKHHIGALEYLSRYVSFRLSAFWLARLLPDQFSFSPPVHCHPLRRPVMLCILWIRLRNGNFQSGSPSPDPFKMD